ncbi:MAG: hypothetical protein ABW190_01455 [Rhizobacter sp.]
MNEAQGDRNPFAPPQARGEIARSAKLLPHHKAARVIRLMGILGVVAVIGIASAILLPAFSSGKAVPAVMLAVLCAAIVLAVGLFFVASAVKSYKAWGRYAGVAYALLMLINIPIGTLIGGYILWQLWFGWAEGSAAAEA